MLSLVALRKLDDDIFLVSPLLGVPSPPEARDVSDAPLTRDVPELTRFIPFS